MKRWLTLTLTVAGLALLGAGRPVIAAAPSAPGDSVRIAVIGDYGNAQPAEAAVAALVVGWAPDLVVTTGDNNYPDGTAAAIDANIGQYYHGYIFPYLGQYGAGASVNRFFPTLGNHDWRTPGAQPYLDYFALPGNERYYDFTWGPVHLFAVDSDPHEPDGITAGSAQALWLQAALAGSTSPWNLVYMHHPPYSSGLSHGSTPALQWPYAEWGATAVLAGHDHAYERLQREGVVYLVVGSSGQPLNTSGPPITGSQVIYTAQHGALLMTASPTTLTVQFVNVAGAVVDSYTLHKPLAATHWTYLPSLMVDAH